MHLTSHIIAHMAMPPYIAHVQFRFMQNAFRILKPIQKSSKCVWVFRNTGANAFAKNQTCLAYEDERDLYCISSLCMIWRNSNLVCLHWSFIHADKGWNDYLICTEIFPLCFVNKPTHFVRDPMSYCIYPEKATYTKINIDLVSTILCGHFIILLSVSVTIQS